MSIAEKARALKDLHRPGEPLVLVNAWDAVSARLVEELGFAAVATTSAGVAWLEGFADGERMSREAMLAAVRRVTAAVRVPVTADLERGYGSRVEDAAATARGAIEAGAAGLNFEDWDLDTNALCAIDLQSTRIKAIRETGESLGVPLVINARTDMYLQNLGDNDSWRFDETVRRANAYLGAGADCAFVPGVTDETLIARLVQAIRGPVSVLAFASSPPVPALAKAGVARISVGGSSMGIALAAFKEFALDVSQRGDFSKISQRIPGNELNALFD